MPVTIRAAEQYVEDTVGEKFQPFWIEREAE